MSTATTITETLFSNTAVADTPNQFSSPLLHSSAAELVKQKLGGKILSVDEEQRDGQILFRVKVLHQDGKVKIHRVNPNTGHIE